MLHEMNVVVVMPAYNARKTLEWTYHALPHDIVDTVLLTDDASTDATATLARELGIPTIVHPKNRGYGGNQKTCYREALATGADIIVMVHPDYQYSPKLVTAMAGMIASGHYDLVLASRILGGRARQGGMPRYKYLANRFLTLIQNVMCRAKLSEYHTGFRAYSRKLLETIDFEHNSDDFAFDNQVMPKRSISIFQSARSAALLGISRKPPLSTCGEVSATDSAFYIRRRPLCSNDSGLCAWPSFSQNGRHDGMSRLRWEHLDDIPRRQRYLYPGASLAPTLRGMRHDKDPTGYPSTRCRSVSLW